jgi:hypothetical protein
LKVILLLYIGLYTAYVRLMYGGSTAYLPIIYPFYYPLPRQGLDNGEALVRV